MEKKMTVLEKAARMLDLPTDIVANLPRMEVRGCREVLIENHRGILEYGNEEMHINGGGVMLKFKGIGLNIRSMNSDEMIIEGQILSIEFVY